MSTTKKCPYCGGEIKIQATKCKHCKQFIPKANETIEYNNVEETKSKKISLILISISALLLVSFIGTAYYIKHFTKNNYTQEIVKTNEDSKDVSQQDIIADYTNGNWQNLYSQWITLSLQDIGNNQLSVNLSQANTATGKIEWLFTCNYQDSTTNLACTDGEKFETYYMCDERRMNNTGELDECSNAGGNVKEVKESIKQNMTATFSLTKGNLKNLIDKADVLSDDRSFILQNSKDMTLLVEDISDEKAPKGSVFYDYNENN